MYICIFVHPCSVKGVRRELAGRLSSWGSWGLSGKQATPVHPQAVSWAASPAPGIRHFPGAGGHQGCGELETITPRDFILSPLSYPCQWKSHRHSPGPTWGVLPGLSPKDMLSRLESCHLIGNFWAVSPNTVTAPLACGAAQKCLFQCGRGDRGQLSLPSQPAHRLGPCLCKQRANTCLGPLFPSLFLGPQGQVVLPCPVFSHHDLSRVCSEPQGWPVSQKQTQACMRMSRCSYPWEEEASQVSPVHRTRAAHKRSFMEGTESRKRPKSTKIIYCF